MFKTDKYKYPLVLMGIFQMIFLVGALLQYLLQKSLQPNETWKQLIILGSIAASIIVNFLVIGKMAKAYEKEALLTTRESLAQSFTSLAESIRTQNQDFIHNIQEISRLFRNDQIEALSGYLEDLSGKVSLYNDVLKVDNAIIGALLNVKATEADARRIRLKIDISTSLSGLETKALDVARIAANLIDNAFDAVCSLKEDQQNVSLNISRVGSLLQIEVSNPGLVVDLETAKHIFEPGYTTKGEGHSGLGLYIVRTLSEKLGGTVRFSSDETRGIRFMVFLPGL